MHDRVPLWEGLCRAVGSDCYRNTTVKYGAITNGVRAHVSQQENKGFVHFTGRFSVGCDVCVVP